MIFVLFGKLKALLRLTPLVETRTSEPHQSLAEQDRRPPAEINSKLSPESYAVFGCGTMGLVVPFASPRQVASVTGQLLSKAFYSMEKHTSSSYSNLWH